MGLRAAANTKSCVGQQFRFKFQISGFSVKETSIEVLDNDNISIEIVAIEA